MRNGAQALAEAERNIISAQEAYVMMGAQALAEATKLIKSTQEGYAEKADLMVRRAVEAGRLAEELRQPLKDLGTHLDVDEVVALIVHDEVDALEVLGLAVG